MKKPVSYKVFLKKLQGFKRPDSIKHGLAQGMVPKDFDMKDLYAGYKVELEHTKNFNVSVAIAMDHLTEYSDYYRALEIMEGFLEIFS